MTTIDWVIFVTAWSLIPLCLFAKGVLDHRQRMTEMQDIAAAGMKRLADIKKRKSDAR